MKEFEKRYDGLTVEKNIQEFWRENEIFKFDPQNEAPVYSIDTPPPTVNGSLHIGHIFSYTQAEMIARYRRMQGYNVFYPFGFDDNGLPSERLVEKETGVRAMDVPRSKFIEDCISTTSKYEAQFKELWQAMGFSCDWGLQYSTVSKKAQAISQEKFIELAKSGAAYIKSSPVLWCTECQTSIAQAELETKELDSVFNYIPFMVEGNVLEIATTRPELLYGVVCVFVNPEDTRYKHLIGKNATVPLYNFEVPIMSDEKVSPEKGTGAVMCATFGDSTDMEWYAKYDLPYKKVILPNGRIDDTIPYIGGLRVRAARKAIIEALRENNLLIREEKLTHTVAVHERCGTEVEIIPSKQWYIDVLSKKDELLQAGEEISWYPASMKNRYKIWVDNLKWDWCISRQRYFGVPFPVWYCKKCGKPHYADISRLPVNPLETPYEGICECGCNEFIPESAVLDTWATSFLSPMINAKTITDLGYKGKFSPMSMRTQAHEIIRTWAFYTITRSLYHNHDIPWNDIMVCGFVLAKPGEKISKSKGNSKLTPEALLEAYPADMIRYWAASSRLGTDAYFDERELVETGKRLLTKLWNASKFCLFHLADFDPNRDKKLLPIDRWIIERTKQVTKQAQNYLDAYEVGLARHEIDDLFWHDLCDDYVEIVKERLYEPNIHGDAERAGAQFALYYTLLNILKMYAIYIPHITEYIYFKGFQEFEGSKSIHLLTWEKVDDLDEDILTFGEEFKSAMDSMRKYKATNSLSMKEPMDSLTIECKPSHRDLFEDEHKDLVACTHAEQIIYDAL